MTLGTGRAPLQSHWWLTHYAKVGARITKEPEGEFLRMGAMTSNGKTKPAKVQPRPAELNGVGYRVVARLCSVVDLRGGGSDEQMLRAIVLLFVAFRVDVKRWNHAGCASSQSTGAEQFAHALA